MNRKIESLTIFEKREGVGVENVLIKLQEYGITIFENMCNFKIIEKNKEKFVEYTMTGEGL